MAAAAGGWTSFGAFARRPRPPARHFQFCLPFRPWPRRAPGRPGLSPPPEPPARIRPLSGRPALWALPTCFVCSLTWRSGPARLRDLPGARGARGAREPSPTLDALPGGEEEAGSPGGAPASALLGCPPGAPRVRAAARTFSLGWKTRAGRGSRQPDHRRADA